jgi:hypothetical protein
MVAYKKCTKMKINIPCPHCGCQTCDAKTKTGDPVIIVMCRCLDGSGEFSVEIKKLDGSHLCDETYRCSKDEIENSLTSRFHINLETISHKCL